MNSYCLCFSIWVCCKIDYFWALFRFCKEIIFISCNTTYIKPFHHWISWFSISVNHIVNSSWILLFKNWSMNNLLTNKNFRINFNNFHRTIFFENNNIIDIRTIAYKLILTHWGSYKPFFSIDVQFFISYNNFCCIDTFKYFNFCFSSFIRTIFLFKIFKIINSIFNDIIKIIFYLFNSIF